jgi:hypothetical protein
MSASTTRNNYIDATEADPASVPFAWPSGITDRRWYAAGPDPEQEPDPEGEAWPTDWICMRVDQWPASDGPTTDAAAMLAMLGRFGAINWIFVDWSERGDFPS